jgi:AcrR family transcriptional regulator
MTQPPDRRTERTKRALRDALLQLMQDRKFEQISTMDIVRRADVGRSTFYAHYADKEDLLLENLDALADHIRAQMQPAAPDRIPGPLLFSLPMLAHMHGVKEMFVTLLRSEGSRTVQHMFHHTLCTLVSEGLNSDNVPESVPKSILVKIIAGGFMAVAKWWVTEAPDKSVDEIHELFVNLVTPLFSQKK